MLRSKICGGQNLLDVPDMGAGTPIGMSENSINENNLNEIQKREHLIFIQTIF
jgi:hypothetical protein